VGEEYITGGNIKVVSESVMIFHGDIPYPFI